MVKAAAYFDITKTLYVYFLYIALITQLQRDNYITAEEACQLTSSKLFISPVPVVTTMPVTNASSNSLTDTNNSIVTDSSRSAMQSVTTNQHTCVLASGSVVETSSCPARSTAYVNASNTSSECNDTFTSDYQEHKSQSLLPVVAEVPDVTDSCNNAPVILSSVQYTVQSSQCTNSMDVTETVLIDNVLSHTTNKSKHNSM